MLVSIIDTRGYHLKLSAAEGGAAPDTSLQESDFLPDVCNRLVRYVDEAKLHLGRGS